MDATINPYMILGVAQDALTEDIKQAYRRIAMRLHPDKNPNVGAVVQLQDVNAAYDLLIDSASRAQYDEVVRQRTSAQQAEFLLRVTPSKRYVHPIQEPQIIYMLAEIYTGQSTIEEADHRRQTARLNLTLLLDRSNSMNGTRLDRVRAAAHQIIDMMNDGDFLSVVVFNDFAEVAVEAAPLEDRALMKARVSMINASGGTEIYRGLRLAVEQNRKNRANQFVNHIIMLTDGNTYGDQPDCLALAQEVNAEGIGISAMGIGQEWNDEFLDKLTGLTGGGAEFIMSPNAVGRFLNDHVRNLANTFAERVVVSIAPDAEISLESAFRLSPKPQPLPIDNPLIPVGNLQYHRMTSILFQLELPANLSPGFRSIARISARGDILQENSYPFIAVSDISLGVTSELADEEPPANVIDALGKLTLYRMQERAHEALERGDTREATRRLEKLATRLLEQGEAELAQQALAEARQVAYTNTLSDRGRKTLKYQTRSLLLGSGDHDE
ncbi:MAG: VWA domain-containing protein [Anaerolineae bacterium]|nr:VWA domain-containing protein [Anaerolineae bacterium]NUQ02535.1 VWA domain-containing protein [Anaerolineae bacterium]